MAPVRFSTRSHIRSGINDGIISQTGKVCISDSLSLAFRVTEQKKFAILRADVRKKCCLYVLAFKKILDDLYFGKYALPQVNWPQESAHCAQDHDTLLAMKLNKKNCHSTQIFGPKNLCVHTMGTPLGPQTAKYLKNASAHSWRE
jgi:hypothetical protein